MRRDDSILWISLTHDYSPLALIKPAQGHSEVIVAAVAARDRSRAEAYAKKHDIPIVHSSYEGTISNYPSSIVNPDEPSSNVS